MELKEIVDVYQDKKMEIALQVGQAKIDLKKKEYKLLIEESGLSKDQVSMSLKRFLLYTHKFSLDRISEFPDKQLKKLTKKMVFTKDPLIEALYKFRDNQITYEEFLMALDMFTVKKTDDEKAMSKAKSLNKFLIEHEVNNLAEVTQTVIRSLHQPMIEEILGLTKREA